MRIAIVSTGNSLESQASPVFGRCSHFVIVELDNNEIKNVKSVENTSMRESGGAGIKSAQLIAGENVDILLSGAVGPNAFEVLKQFGIRVYRYVPGTVDENLKLFKGGKLEEISVPENISGRGGRGRGFRRR